MSFTSEAHELEDKRIVAEVIENNFEGAAMKNLVDILAGLDTGLPSPFQQEFAKIISEELSERLKQRRESEEDMTNNIAEYENDIAILISDIASKRATTTKATVDRDIRSSTSKELNEYIKTTAFRHKEKKEHKRALAEQVDEFRNKRACIDAVGQGALRMLIAGGWDEQEMASMSIESLRGIVTEYMPKLSKDKCFMASMDLALEKLPAERIPFEILVSEMVCEEFTNSIAELNKKIDNYASQEAVLCAEEMGAGAIADLAKDDSNDATTALNTANLALESAIKDEEVSKTTLKDMEASKEVQFAARFAEDNLIDCLEKGVSAFKRFSSCDYKALEAVTVEVLEQGKNMQIQKSIDSNVSIMGGGMLGVEAAKPIPDVSAAEPGLAVV